MSKKKLLSIVVAGLIALGGLHYMSRQVIHNVMSHCGYREEKCDLTKPSTYLTMGHYRGFVNTFLLPNGDEPIDANPKNFTPDPFNKLDESLSDLDLNRVYLGLQKNPLPKSSYRPTRLTNSEAMDFYSIADFIVKPEKLVGTGLGLKETALEKLLNLKIGEVMTWKEVTDEKIRGYTSMEGEEELVTHNPPRSVEFTNVDLHQYTFSFGKDERGIYTSIYDVWDFTPNSGYFRVESNRGSTRFRVAAAILPIVGTPIHLYDRLYWKDYEVKVP